HDFDFIITGEVVGQRPMSQRKDTMPVVARDSGAEDRLVRPLSGQNLPATLPEREGWISRDKLYGFNGRSRKPQMALAKEFGLEDYAQPAGGCCFLTDAQYSVKLADLWKARGEKQYEMDDIMLLKVGRHLRPQPHFKVIISREEGEGNFLQGYRKLYVTLSTVSHAGPLALIDGAATPADIELACQLVARYSQGKSADQVEMDVRQLDGTHQKIFVKPLSSEQIPQAWYI
ncbi:MAG: tRNA (5-methylaminomethyl-2-thiouridylate)-methyltransferase, partial [Sedimenticola sp.]|nr:tRNA (5-methylaminomethyl-2-thiouridylate)-methyltransferase [Sedimenticola sp.]